MLSIGLIPHFFILFSVSFYFKVSLTFSARFLLSSVFVFRSSVKFICTGLPFLPSFSSGFFFFFTDSHRTIDLRLPFFLPSVILLLIKIDIFLKAFLGSPSYVFGGPYLSFLRLWGGSLSSCWTVPPLLRLLILYVKYNWVIFKKIVELFFTSFLLKLLSCFLCSLSLIVL